MMALGMDGTFAECYQMLDFIELRRLPRQISKKRIQGQRQTFKQT